MYYNARWYDPSLGRFAQADTIIASLQEYDRYAYVGNNPIRYTDPSGRCRIDAKADDCLKSDKSNKPTSEENYQSDFEIFYSGAKKKSRKTIGKML